MADRPHPLAAAPRLRAALLLGAALAALWVPRAAQAQFSSARAPASQPVSKSDPVFYTADATSYDRDGGLVTLSGHVEIWQGARVIRADQVTYDRDTGVAAARGNVALLDPSGQVVFADYAELTQGMKDGVLTNMRALLPDNGRLAANGARRTDAQVNELSRAIYSTCNVCLQHPERAPLWDLRARTAVQDVANKRMEYQDAVLDFYGVPVAWFPYLTHPDPTQRRASGLLVPSIGFSKHLGAFVRQPYFWAIDGATDATITPLLATRNGPALEAQLRHAFNNGKLTVNMSAGDDHGQGGEDIFANGQFAINDEWRWGFDLQRASTITYLRDFHLPGIAPVLTSQIYLEGFGQGAYTKLDARAYQGLSSNTVSSQLPYVLPRYEYSFVGEPDALGGRTSVDAGAFNIVRKVGTNTERASLRVDWERPATGAVGDLWKLVLHADGAGYYARQLDQQPSWGPRNSADTAQGMPTAALEWRWPLVRDAGNWGSQVVEPIVQLIGAPQGSKYGMAAPGVIPAYLNTLIPNEDSLDFDFTDANLFSLNRFPGIDRLEGGTRANVALHGAWYFPAGQKLDAQVGQGYRTHTEGAFPYGSGLQGKVTDVVSHVDYAPNPWFDLLSRQRFAQQSMQLHFADAVASGGPDWLRLSAGYLYSSYNPYSYYDSVPTGSLPTIPRNEVSAGVGTRYGRWRVSANARRDIQTGQMVSVGAGGAYEDECFVFDVSYFRRYYSIAGDNGSSTLLFQITFKTVGTIGFNGL